MKIERIQSLNSNFKGKRVDKNIVSQLITKNSYSLTEPNQRYIAAAIEKLGKVAGEKNIQFLLDVAAKNRYSTSITLQDMPQKNNWKEKLLASAASAIAITPLANNALTDKLAELQKPAMPNIEEQEILKLREQLLGVVDLEQINNETVGSIKNFSKNLDYFIISSETSLEHKKYVLERLNYFMSDKYEINPQLKNKKSIAAAEMVNDIAIHTPGNEIPNIKAVNQKQHGMCAAISIVRKKLAYEDKPNYIDSILSELDSSQTIKVYDRSRLGSGEKIDVHKVSVDFDTALAKGYRIIDASTTHWMHIAGMTGESNIAYDIYTPFDNENFDVKADSFFHVQFDDKDLGYAQKYYQSLIKAKSVLEDYKAEKIKFEILQKNAMQTEEKKIKTLAKLNSELKTEISNIAPNLSTTEVQNLATGLFRLEKSVSSKIKPQDKFSYIHNEEEAVKKSKIKNYIIEESKNDRINEDSINKIFLILNQSRALNSKVSKSSEIRRANQLYEIAAAFRYQIITGLESQKILNNVMQNEGITNKEELLINTIDTLIEKLENNSSYSDLILKQLSKSAFDTTNGSKEEILNGLHALKDIISYNLTERMDSIYAALTMGSRKDALYNYLDNTQKLIKEGNTYLLEPFAEKLGVNKSIKNVLKGLEADKQKLLNGDEKDYNKLFNKYGSTSQIEHLNNIFNNFVQQSSQEDNQETIVNFLNANGLTVEDGEEAVTDRINLIAQNLQAMEIFMKQVSEALKVVDENGDILISANPKDVIIKKLENENKMASSKKLKEIQNHLNNIAKERSSDEFQSRQGKLKDKSLYKFSNTEKETLKEVDKSINAMYSFVQKQLKYVRTDMKEYLEEIARITGINGGKFWVGEGESGLGTDQEIRILEYMTGRPHYSTQDYQEAINKIKTSPYSGISASSVYHDRIGGHAQYIADIESIEIKDKNGNIQTKEVLFNDNTWGASEKENTWIDSSGLTRTDYSDNRGGALGYITNDKYRNGNLVDRILSDMLVQNTPGTIDNKIYKKIKKNTKSEPFPQYYGAILDGKSKKIKTTSDKLHDAIFVNNSRFINKLQKIGEKHTEAELQAMITNIQHIGKSWKSTYETLKKRIFPITGNGINSQEEYNKLADNDYLKVILEKIALRENAQVTGLEPDIARVRNVKELNKFRAAQKTRALNSFKYAFSKSEYIVNYLAESFGEKEFDKFEALLDKHKIKLSDEEISKIGEDFSLDTKKFDGSAKTTINLIMENIQASINNIIKDVNAQEEFADFYRNFLTEKIYFNEQDLDMDELENQKYSHIISFIDKVYNPEDNEEFVKIYRTIQDMTNQEFKSEVLSKTTYEDMGVKSLTGFDILKKLQRYDEKANTNLINAIYYDSLVTEINTEKYEPIYSYERFARKAKYSPNYNFNTIYRDLNSDLSLLTMPKLFNKYKDRNLNKYNVYPAYPQIEFLSENFINKSFNSSIENIEKNVHTIKTLNEQIQNYEIAHLLTKLKNTAKENQVIKGQNYNIIVNLFSRLIALNHNDPSVQEVFNSALEALQIEEGSKWQAYLPYINSIINRLTDFENTTSKEVLSQVIAKEKSEVIANKKIFNEVFIQPKYQSRVAETYNKFEQALIKEQPQAAEALKNQLLEEFKKYNILNTPEELLGQFIKSCAKDSRLNPYNGMFTQLLTRAIDYAKLAEIQDIIMEAIGDGVALNAKSKFNKYTLSFNSGEYLMGSDEMVSYMTNQLIIDNEFETGLLFLEKFGLSEQYIKHAAESFDFEKLENLIKDAHLLADNFSNFQTSIEADFAEAQKGLEDENCDYAKILNKLRSAIYEKGSENSLDEEYLNTIITGIDTVEYNYEINPNVQKLLVFTTVMGTSKNKMVEAIRAKIQEKDIILGSSTTIANFINQILLPEGSEAEKLRNEINNNFNNLFVLKQSLIKDETDDEN